MVLLEENSNGRKTGGRRLAALRKSDVAKVSSRIFDILNNKALANRKIFSAIFRQTEVNLMKLAYTAY